MKTFPLLAAILLSHILSGPAAPAADTVVGLKDGRWTINGRLTNPGSSAEGHLMNVRMVNAVFEDRNKRDFDPEANTSRFIARIPDYRAQGVNAFTVCLQGGMPGYEGAINSALEPDGSLRSNYLARAERLIRECDRHGVVIILGIYYQRQSAILRDDAAIRAGVVNVARWITERGFRNVLLEIANEYPHKGFVHPLIRQAEGQANLINLAKATAPGLLVSASGYGDGKIHPQVAEAADFLLPHWNSTPVSQIPARIKQLKTFGKPIVCNEDDKTGTNAVAAMLVSIQSGAGYGLMLSAINQTPKIGRHPSHGLGMPARDLARIAYCMLHGGRWVGKQVIPRWFVDETSAPTHNVTTPELRWKLNPAVFSHGWELPARHNGGPSGRTGEGIPPEARGKPGSGGQFIAFVPSLDLVLTRQTGSSGSWDYEEYLRRACAAVLSAGKP